MNLYYDYTTRPRRRQEDKPSAPPPRPLPAPRPFFSVYNTPQTCKPRHIKSCSQNDYKSLLCKVSKVMQKKRRRKRERTEEKRQKQSGENAMRAECCRSKPRQNVRRRKHPTAKIRSALSFKNAAESKEAFCTLNFFTYGAFLGYNNGNKKIFERSAFQ